MYFFKFFFFYVKVKDFVVIGILMILKVWVVIDMGRDDFVINFVGVDVFVIWNICFVFLVFVILIFIIDVFFRISFFE